MSERIETYLNDHLAGAKFATDLLRNMREEHAGTPLAEFTGAMLTELEGERDLLKDLVSRVGGSNRTNYMKEWSASIAEKMSRMKFHRSADNAMGTLESLEFLSLGVLGRRALWRALSEVAEKDERFQGVDYNHLADIANKQHEELEELRLDAVRLELRDHKSYKEADIAPSP